MVDRFQQHDHSIAFNMRKILYKAKTTELLPDISTMLGASRTM